MQKTCSLGVCLNREHLNIELQYWPASVIQNYATEYRWSQIFEDSPIFTIYTLQGPPHDTIILDYILCGPTFQIDGIIVFLSI